MHGLPRSFSSIMVMEVHQHFFQSKTILQWDVDKVSVQFQQIKFVLGHVVLITGFFLPFGIIDNGLIMTKMPAGGRGGGRFLPSNVESHDKSLP
jgi:hypothetical protein